MTTDNPKVKALMEHLQTHPVFADVSMETLIDTVRELVEADLRAYVLDDNGSNLDVVACLEGCINHLGDAKMAYYASLK
jgi:hypothetical protein